MPPLVSIQNPGHEKLQEVVSRALAVFVLRKKKSQTWGGNGVKKNRVQKLLDSVFFQTFPPHVWDFGFFQSTKIASALDTPSCNFSEPGFWILTKGGIRQPVVYQPYPNSIQVLGMEQPSLVPIHNFGAYFCTSRVKVFCVLNRGLWTLLGTFPKSLFKIWPF